MKESKIISIQVGEGIDKLTGLPYTTWTNEKCNLMVSCASCQREDKNYDIYNDLCTIRRVK